MQNTRHPENITLGEIIQCRDAIAAALVHTQVVRYFPKLNNGRCCPLHLSIQYDILFCAFGYGPDKNSLQTMPTVFCEHASNRVVRWVFYYNNHIHKDYNNLNILE